MSKFELGDYVDVASRISWFLAKHPEGSLQSEVITAPEGFVGVKAYASRMPGDPSPGVGHAYEPFPGTTPYTKNSELMVCETSAWGRALAAVGAPTKGKVASSDEIEASQQRVTESSVTPPQQTQGALSTACAHATWEDVPGRPGMQRCVGCGTARKGNKDPTKVN